MTIFDAISRRRFLQGSGISLAGLGMTALGGGPFMRYALGDEANNKKMIFIFQRGGNDGINTLIPHGDQDYNTTIRPSLYISPTDAIDLQNGFCNYHPALSEMMPLHNSGNLAAIHRVGYAGQSRSHFDSQRIWENGNPDDPGLFEGWLYRFIESSGLTQGTARLPVITSQSSPPVLLRGRERFVNIGNPNDFDYSDPDPRRSKYTQAWRRRYEELGGPEIHRPALSDIGLKLVDTVDEFRSWDHQNWHPTDPVTGEYLFPVNDATNPDDLVNGGKKFSSGAFSYFRSLKVCALSLLEAANNNNCTRIVGTQITGWDHHATQGRVFGSHPTLLKRLAYGMNSLWTVLSGAATNEPRNYASVWDDTIVVTLTEFGRTTNENGSGGTDHAEAALSFVAGGSVIGGIYNCDASSWGTNNGVMFESKGRYLSHASDYRAVMWEILRDHMGADAASVDTIFPSYTSLGLNEVGFLT